MHNVFFCNVLLIQLLSNIYESPNIDISTLFTLYILITMHMMTYINCKQEKIHVLWYL